MAANTIRALILSGGGGRGAFHAGVYKYLMRQHKLNLDSAHANAWEPEIIVGTSIGAVNGAAIAQGMSADQLVEVWKSLEEKDIQGLPPGMRGIARWVARTLFREVMDTNLQQIPTQEATSPDPKEFWPPLPLLPNWIAERLVGRWINLLDTGPLRKTLYTRFGLDEKKLAASEKSLLIAATKVRTGERVLFSNRAVRDHKRGNLRRDVFTGISELYRKGRDGTAGSAAVVLAGLNDRDRAFQWLDLAFRSRDPVIGYLKVDPRFDNLRSDPRFAKLLLTVGLTAQ